MRRLLSLLFALAIAAVAPAQVAPAPAVAAQPMLIPAPWNPIADYVEPGQDEPGYRQWIARNPWRSGQVRLFHDYLTTSGVSYVAPTWQLLRTASDWRRCGAEPFEVPPQDEWANIVNTLRYVRDYVVPAVGPVEPVSVFRNAALNRCAGGAPESVHRSMSAIDFVPLQPIGRGTMIGRLCSEHQRQGPRFNAGLGFYAKMRFHVDSWKYRTWGRNDHGHIACPKVEVKAPVLAAVPVGGSGTAQTPNSASVTVSATPALKPPETVTTLPAKDPLAPL
jgi:hypothetical protein